MSDLFLHLAEEFMKAMCKEGFFHPAFPVLTVLMGQRQSYLRV